MKFMKLLTVIFGLIFFHPPIFSQPRTIDTIPEEWNFFKLEKNKERQFSKIESSDSEENHQHKEYMRWKWFWNNRIDASGNLKAYPKQMAAHYQLTDGQSLCEDDCDFSCFPSNWSYLGPDNLETQSLGKVLSVWVNPSNDQHILIGADGGLWKTVDGGSNWEALTDFCLPGVGVLDIAVRPNNIDIIYVATSGTTDFGHGVFKSADGGITWVKLNMGLGNTLEGKVSTRVIIHPINHNHIYATVGHEVFKSVDGGNSWNIVFSEIQNPKKLLLKDLAIIPSINNDEIYVTGLSKIVDWNCNSVPADTYCLLNTLRAQSKVWYFKSPFNGLSSSSHDDLTDDLPDYPANCHLAMLSFTANSLNIVCMEDGLSFYKKTSGNPWVKTVTQNMEAGCFNWVYSLPFEVSPFNDQVIYLGGTTLKKSMDGGLSFNCVCTSGCPSTIYCSNCSWPYWAYLSNPNFSGSHPDVRYLTIYQASTNDNEDVLFFGTDGGLGKSTDGGNSSLNLNGDNLQLSQFFGISNNETQPNHIYGGTQDNGVFDNTNQSWRVNTINIGDAYETAADPNDPNTAYTTNNGGQIRKTTNGGQSWGVVPCPSGESCGGKPLFVDSNGRLYIGGRDLWRRDDNIWINLSNIPNPSGQIVAFDLSEDENTAYIAYGLMTWQHPNDVPSNQLSKKVYKISNLNGSGFSVDDITAGLEGIRWTGITGIAIEPNQAEKVWVCFGNFWESSKKVYQFDSTTGSWEEYGQGLPDIPSQDLVYWKNSFDLLFLGMDDGVYYRDAAMDKWELFSCELPRTIITDLEINYSLKKLRAATYSRGIWESPIPKKHFTSCNDPANYNVSVYEFGGSPITTTNIMASGDIKQINRKYANVSLNLFPFCVEEAACCHEETIEWKVFKKRLPAGPEYLYQSGDSPFISFQGQYRSGWFFNSRYQYRLEIKGSCGKNLCNETTLIFKG